MSKKVGVAEIKRTFSAVVSEVSLNREHFIIEKKGKPMAAIVSVEELAIIEGLEKGGKRKGLLSAIGAWEDFPDIEKTIENIFDERSKSKDRDIGCLS
jgi:antitoxin (DNA-binding transcriptional repressor) of toxin-antitoxin stability system